MEKGLKENAIQYLLERCKNNLNIPSLLQRNSKKKKRNIAEHTSQPLIYNFTCPSILIRIKNGKKKNVCCKVFHIL